MTTAIELISGGSGTIKTDTTYTGPFISFYVTTAGGGLQLFHEEDLNTDVYSQYFRGSQVHAIGDLIKGNGHRFGKIIPTSGCAVIVIL